MGELINAPIVDIRLIKQQSTAVRYVAKYVTKAPYHYAGTKRYWHTPAYEQDNDYVKPETDDAAPKWHVVMEHLHAISAVWHSEGWAVYGDKKEGISAVFTGVGAITPWHLLE